MKRLRSELERLFLKEFPIEDLILKSQGPQQQDKIQFELLIAKLREEIKLLQNYEVLSRQMENYEALAANQIKRQENFKSK